MFDVLLFNVKYTAMQYGGLAFIFALYVFQGLKFVLYDLPKEKKREAAVRRELENVDKALEEACIRASVLQGRPK